MLVEVLDAARPDESVVRRAATILRAGGLVAFPTETVYGLGANALDDVAVRRIFATKGRPSYNPLIVHVPSTEAARELAADWPLGADELAARFWPGPITLVVPKGPRISSQVTAGLPTVALRVPSHPVALALLREAGVPIAAPSANPFKRLSPTTADHVRQGIEHGIDLILDAGPTPVGIESTVVDLSGTHPVLLRPGTIRRAAIEAVVGPLRSPDAPVDGSAPRASPGMLRQHYSPRARLRVFGPPERAAMERAVQEATSRGERVGALLLGPLDAPATRPVRMPGEPAGYAAQLYSTLHDLDAAGCSLIVVDAVPEGSEWAGVRDRLSRASQGD